MVQFHCLNPIAACGLELFPDTYKKTDDFNAAEVALVRSAAMHDMDLPESLLAVARAGAGSTIFHWKNAQIRESLYSIHQVQTQTVSKSW